MSSLPRIQVLDRIGSIIDYGFLSIPFLLKPFKPKRQITKAQYQRQVEFYFDGGYVENPITLFQFPEDTPAYRILSKTAYGTGFMKLYSYQSQFLPLNPYIRDAYLHF